MKFGAALLCIRPPGIFRSQLARSLGLSSQSITVSGVCLFTNKVIEEGVDRSNPRPGIAGVLGSGDGLGLGVAVGLGLGLTLELGLGFELALGNGLEDGDGDASTACDGDEVVSSPKTSGIVRKTFQLKGLG